MTKNTNPKKKNRRNKGGKSDSASASTPNASNSADPTEAVTKENAAGSSEGVTEQITAASSDKGQPSQVVVIPISVKVDRLSILNLELKMEILSCLPTRCAVATSSLAKDWKYVWTHLPELDFNDDLPSSVVKKGKITFTKEKYALFVNYVNRALILHNPRWLQGLYLVMYDCFNSSHINEWMMFIARLNIQGVCCISHKKKPVKVDHVFFLDKYELDSVRLQGFSLDLPIPPFYLPCLRTLYLSKSIMCDAVTGNPWMRLLSNCPVLEYLEIEYCEELESLSVCSSSMKVLRVQLEKDQQKSVIIKTPNLAGLHLSVSIKELVVNDLASLEIAVFSISISSINWIKLLDRTCCTKNLELYQIYLYDLKTPMQYPTFENLTHMEVGFTSWSTVLPIIRHAPKLTSFIAHKAMYDWPKRKPSIMNIPLEKIEYYDFDGIEGYKELGYFLLHSPQLKRVIVHIPNFLEPTSEIEIHRRLTNLRRASIHCRAKVVYEGCHNFKYDDSDSEQEVFVESDGESEKAADIDDDGDSESKKAVHIDNNGDNIESEKADDIQNDGDIASKKAVDIEN